MGGVWGAGGGHQLETEPLVLFRCCPFASESTGRSGNRGCGDKSIHLYRGLDQWLQRRSLSAETEREEGGRPQLP